MIAGGYDSVRISGSGELPPPGDGPVDAIDEDRLGALGRATLRTVTALDQGGRPVHGPDSYLLIVSQVLPGWVISLLAGTLLLPVVVASVDAFARARRRHIDVLRWLRFVGAWVAPFLAALALAELLALTGATPTPPPAPVPPEVLPLDGPALGVLGGLLAAMLLAFLLARWLAARPDPELKQPVDPGTGVALALALSLGCMLLWALNPYAGLLSVPAAHLWMLAVLTRPLPPRRGRMLMVALGLVPPLLVAVYYWFALSHRSAGGRVVSHDARDRAQRGLRHGARGLPPAGGGLRHGGAGVADSGGGEPSPGRARTVGVRARLVCGARLAGRHEQRTRPLTAFRRARNPAGPPLSRRPLPSRTSPSPSVTSPIHVSAAACAAASRRDGGTVTRSS